MGAKLVKEESHELLYADWLLASDQSGVSCPKKGANFKEECCVIPVEAILNIHPAFPEPNIVKRSSVIIIN